MAASTKNENFNLDMSDLRISAFLNKIYLNFNSALDGAIVTVPLQPKGGDQGLMKALAAFRKDTDNKLSVQCIFKNSKKQRVIMEYTKDSNNVRLVKEAEGGSAIAEVLLTGDDMEEILGPDVRNAIQLKLQEARKGKKVNKDRKKSN